MKIQLIEPFQGGHYTNYVEALLPAFRRYLESGVISEAVVSITPSHYALLQQNGTARSDGLNLRFDATFPSIGDDRKPSNHFSLYQAHPQAVRMSVRTHSCAPLQATQVMCQRCKPSV